ncbi:MAG: NAD(P)-dependent oxidoreductase [Proteobacteria bacterium]|nr:NAD(P)-dependent oxidoreductase [Pseudomonadota bacterium]
MTDKHEVLFLDDASTVLPILPPLHLNYTVRRLAEGAGAEAIDADARDRIRALVTTTNRGIEAAVIEALPRLEIIVLTGGHLHGVALETLQARGIRLTNTPGITAEDVADTVMGLALSAAKRLVEGDRFVRAGRWTREEFGFGVKITGKRMGILGLGRVGSLVARRALGFDMEVHYAEPVAKSGLQWRHHTTALDLARAVQILAVTCPSGPATRHIVDRAVIEALGPRGVLVSVVKGAVDEGALIEALEHGRLAAAGLDVFEGEPAINPRLARLDNLVMTPHAAWKSVEAQQTITDLALANLAAHFAGLPLLTPVEAH